MIEDLENLSSINLDRLRGIYTLTAFEEPKNAEVTPKDLHEMKLKELDTLRRSHSEKSIALLDKFKDMIRQSLDETADGTKTLWDD